MSARTLISSATTAKPLPASPALAASIDAFNDKRFVWLVISKISPVSPLIFSTFLLSIKASSTAVLISLIIFL